MAKKMVYLLLENIEYGHRSYVPEILEAGDQTKAYGGAKIYNLIGKTTSLDEASEFILKHGKWAK